MTEIGKALTVEGLKSTEIDTAVKVLTYLSTKVGASDKTYTTKTEEAIQKGNFSDSTKKAMLEDAAKQDAEIKARVQVYSLTASNSIGNVLTMLKNAKGGQEEKKK